MRASNDRSSRWGSRFFLIGLLILVLIPFGYAGARSFVRLDDASPAMGRAQVITQGISALPTDKYVMRVVQRIAPARGDAKVGRRVLGFALATDEPILITEVTGPDDSQFQDEARLAPGEAYLTLDGTRQIRASLSGAPANYISIEFVSPDQASNVGTGKLLYASDVLSTPQGQHDLDFVRNLLAQSDFGEVPDTGGSVLILATDGAIDILPGRSRRIRLSAGQSAVFDSEDLRITASDDSAYGVPSNQLASLTNMLQTDNPIAGYVVVVIGPEVPKTGETPTVTSSPTVVSALPTTAPVNGSTQAPPIATATQVTSGSIGVTGRLCNPGVPAGKVNDTDCPVYPDGFAMALNGNGVARTLEDAVRVDSSWYWQQLAPGTYSVSVTSLPTGAESYVIPESGAVSASEGGYTVSLTDTSPQVNFPVYFLQPAPRQSTAPVRITFQVCNPGSEGPVDCTTPAAQNVDPAPYLVDGAGNQLAPAQGSSDGVYSWDLPKGSYTLYQGGWQYSYVVNGTTFDGGSGYPLSSDGQSEVDILVQDINYIIE